MLQKQGKTPLKHVPYNILIKYPVSAWVISHKSLSPLGRRLLCEITQAEQGYLIRFIRLVPYVWTRQTLKLPLFTSQINSVHRKDSWKRFLHLTNVLVTSSYFCYKYLKRWVFCDDVWSDWIVFSIASLWSHIMIWEFLENWTCCTGVTGGFPIFYNQIRDISQI